MSTENKKISAFPISENDYNIYNDELPKWSGMTLRDYFAGQCISNQVWEASQHSEEIALRAYKLADAMLKQREL